MKHLKLTVIALLGLSLALGTTSCKKKGCTDSYATNYDTEAEKDDETCSYALNESVEITMRNTLQNPDSAEVTYASLFGQPDDAFDEFATLSNSSVEFATALAQTGTPVG